VQEGQRNTEIHDLKREVLEARSLELALLQQIAEGKESVAALKSRVEGLEIDLGEKEAVLRSLEDALKEEVVKNLKMEDQRTVSAEKEEELERQLDVMRQTIAASNESIVGMQGTLMKLEGDCEDKEKMIGSLRRVKESLQTEVDTKAKDKEVLALTERLREHQNLVVERDTLIFDLSKKIEELEFNCAEIGDIPDGDSTLMHTARLTDEVTDDYELTVRQPNHTIDSNRHVLEKEERIAELEGKLAGMEEERKSLLSVSRKQEKRLAKMEVRVLTLTLKNEGLEDTRVEERARTDRDPHALRSTLVDRNGFITKVEEEVAKLKAEAELKDAKIKSLSQAKEGEDRGVNGQAG
jgi:chromosome segregation ATPase